MTSRLHKLFALEDGEDDLNAGRFISYTRSTIANAYEIEMRAIDFNDDMLNWIGDTGSGKWHIKEGEANFTLQFEKIEDVVPFKIRFAGTYQAYS